MKKKILSFFMVMVLVLGTILLPLPTPTAQAATFTDLDQNQMVAAMGAGWNLGNQLEASASGVPSETAWGNPVITQNFINTVKNAGFKTIRIPVSYLNKIGSAPNYTIDAAWMARVKEVVDYAMNAGLYAIVNMHGDGYNTVNGGWLLPDATDQATIKDKYKKVWTQIANTFSSYDEHLIFESMNEVGEYAKDENLDAYYTNMNAYNQIFVDAVRATGGNNTKRWLLIPGVNTNIDYTVYSTFAVPTDSLCTASGKRIMISVHYYGPAEFCITKTNDVTQWGSVATDVNKTAKHGNEDYMTEELESLYNKFVTQGYPVIIGEFGAMDKSYGDTNNQANREHFAKTICLLARKYGMVPVLWDNGVITSNEFGFGVFDRPNNKVSNQGLIDAIMNSFSAPLPTTAPTPDTVTQPIKSLKYYFNVTGVTNESSITFKCTDAGWGQYEIPLSLNGNGSYTLTVQITKINVRGMKNLGTFTQNTSSSINVNLTKILVNDTYELPFNLNAAVNNQWNGFGNIWSGLANGTKISTGTNCHMAFNDDPNISGDEALNFYISTPAFSYIKYDFNITGVTSPTTLTFNTMNNDTSWSSVAKTLTVNGNGNYSITIYPNSSGMRNMGYFTTITGSNVIANLTQITVNGYVVNYSKSLQIGSTYANSLNNIWDGTAAGAKIAEGTSAILQLNSDKSAFKLYKATSISSIKYDFNVTGVTSQTTLTFNTMNNDGSWSTVAKDLTVNGNGNYSVTINPNSSGMRSMGYFTTITGSNIVANLTQITVNGSDVLNYSKSLQIGSTYANGLNNIWDGTTAGTKIAEGTSAFLRLNSDKSAFLLYTTK